VLSVVRLISAVSLSEFVDGIAQETHQMQVIDAKRRRFIELVRQQKTVCQLLACQCIHMMLYVVSEATENGLSAACQCIHMMLYVVSEATENGLSAACLSVYPYDAVCGLSLSLYSQHDAIVTECIVYHFLYCKIACICFCVTNVSRINI